jgi:hypothetical protein
VKLLADETKARTYILVGKKQHDNTSKPSTALQHKQSLQVEKILCSIHDENTKNCKNLTVKIETMRVGAATGDC